MTTNLSRRKFIQQMMIGGLTTPVLLNMLSSNLLAETEKSKQSIIWVLGQSSGIHRSGVWSYPGFHTFMEKHFTLIESDSPDIQEITIESSENGGGHILILDGYFSQDLDDPINILLKDLIVVSRAAILMGNEASYSQSAPDGFLDLEKELLYLVETPYFKLPGNPVPIRHLVGALNHLKLYGPPELDEYRRPNMFYSQVICERCQYRGDFEQGNFVRRYGQKEGCLYLLGCKGPVTRNSCAVEKWNGTASWCVSAGSPCTGCSEPDYPNNSGLGLFGQLNADNAPINSFFVRNASTIAQGAFGVTLAGVAIHAFSGRKSRSMGEDSVFGFEEDTDE
ncbi:MAG: hypothetical protein MJE63_14535 [Proteobacteria bacterium]|nr:hypothetical protein [Pseudomonadota bacterium]